MSSNEKPTPNFTMSDLIREIAGIDQDIPLEDKVTTREFMALLGLGSMQATRMRIRPLVMAKPPVLLPVRASRPTMAGTTTSVPAYAANPGVSWDYVMEVLNGKLNGSLGGS